MRILLLPLLLFGAVITSYSQWTPKNQPDPGNNVYRIQAVGNNTVYASGYFFEIRKSTDAGNTWTFMDMVYNNQDPLQYYNYALTGRGFYFQNATTGFAFGKNALGSAQEIFRTTDGAASWDLVHRVSGGDIFEMTFPTATTGFACGASGRVMKTTDGGNNWTVLGTSTSNTLQTLSFLNASNGLAAGDKIILKTTDGGASWIPVSTSYAITSISMVDATRAFAVTSEGQVLSSMDGGYTWSLLRNNIWAIENGSVQVKFENPSLGFLSTRYGLYKSVDGGMFWSLQHGIGPHNVTAFDFDGNTGYVSAGMYDAPYTRFFLRSATGGDPMPANEARPFNIIQYENNLCRGSYPVKVDVINEGIVPMTQVKFNWSVNGALQTPFTFSGSVATADTAKAITIGTFDFNKTNRDFDVKVWTSLPNGLPDDYTGNDTVSVTYHFNKFTGSYTVGGVDPDFATISETLSLLTTYGVCDDVVFNIRTGTYNTPFSFSSLIPGTSADNTVTFQSENNSASAVVFDYPTNVVNATHTGHLKFKALTLKATSSTAVTFYDSRNITFEDNVITSQTGESFFSLLLINTCYGEITFRNNHFIGGEIGIGLYDGSGSNPQVEKAKRVIVENNTFTNQKRQGLLLGNTSEESLVIRNRFLNEGMSDGYYAMSLSSPTGGVLVANNYVNLVGVQMQPTFVAIYGGDSKLKIFHNTIYVKSSTPSGTISLGAAAHAKVHNNIVVNAGAGPVFYFERSANVESDYNDYYAASATGLFEGEDPTPGLTLSGWRARTGYDLHSVDADPQLIPGDAHLALSTSNYALNGAGKAVAEVTTDLDGQNRNVTTPDIGADEVEAAPVDAGLSLLKAGTNVLCSGNKPVTIRVTNFGSQPITGYSINWKVDNLSQPVFTGGALAAGTFIDVTLGNVDFFTGDHLIQTSLIAAGDQNNRNDVLSITAIGDGLAGAYTVGGTTPDFENISDAINAMRSGGVCGPVTFNIRPGVYSEQLTITAFAGASETAPVIFQSEGGDSTAVTINNGPIIFNGAQWVTIRSVTLTNDRTDVAIVQLTGGSSHNTISSCVFPGNRSTHAVYSEGPKYNEYNTIVLNRFKSDITMSRSVVEFSALYERGNEVVDNVFESAFGSYEGMIVFSNQDGFRCTGNRIDAAEGSGISVSNCFNGFRVTGNTINVGGNGILLSGNEGVHAEKGWIANNMVNAGLAGFNSGNAGNFILTNNTIVSNGGLGGVVINATDFDAAPATNIEVKNNIVVHTGPYFSLIYNPHSGIVSDYNILFRPGNDSTMAYNHTNEFGYEGRTIIFHGLHQWQRATGQDLHSVLFRPRFVSANDLHILNDYRVKGNGIPLGLISDIDGDIRNAAKPDIGADEFVFTPVANDAGVSAFVRPDPCGLDKDIVVKIRNYGSNVLTRATVNWSIDDVEMTPVVWTGSLASGVESAPITVGNFHLSSNDTFNIRAWTTLPNNVADLEQFNDSLYVFDVFQKLSGEFTIGAETSDFKSIRQALDYLNRVGVCGPVTFRIAPGVYPDRLLMKEIEGASATNRITFVSQTGDNQSVIIRDGNMPISHAPEYGYFLVMMDGVDYVMFQSVTFEVDFNNPLYVRLTNNATHNEFLNNRFLAIGGGIVDNNPLRASIAFEKGNNSDTRIEGNYFEGGMIGVGFQFDGSVQRTTIKDNTFRNQAQYGIKLYGSADGTVVEGNNLRMDQPSNGIDNVAITLGYSIGTFDVRNNRISGSYYGGIDISGLTSLPNPTRVVNNMVAGAMSHGIYSSQNENVRFHFNSVNITGDNIEHTAFLSDRDSSLVLTNNNLINKGKGFSVKLFQLDQATAVSDYNNLWTSRHTGILLQQDTFKTLEHYRATKGFEAHSVSFDPDYVTSTDLHARFTGLNATGTPVAGVEHDIDGELRDAVRPDIGADEIELFDHDAGIVSVDKPDDVCEGVNDVYVSLKNYGKLPLTQATINWSINTIDQPQFTWNGSIQPGETSASFKIGTFDFAPSDGFDIRAWTSLPNNNVDQGPRNDSTTVRNFHSRLHGVYTIGGTNPDFPTITKAAEVLMASGVCGPVTFNIRDGQYLEYIDLGEIDGASVQDSVVFQSESGDASKVRVYINTVVAQNNHVWRLERTSFVTLRDMTMQSQTYSNPAVLWIEGPASRVNILSNTFYSTENPNPEIAYGDHGILVSGGPLTQSRLSGNTVYGGGNGIYLYNGWSTVEKNQQLTICDNQLIGQARRGIEATFLYNSIITRNTIKSAIASPYSSTAGIAVMFGEHVVLTENKITVTGNGIVLSRVYYPTVANNFISVTDTNSDWVIYGLDLQNASGGKVYYNSVSILNDNPQHIATRVIQGGEDPRPPGGVELRNNIFSNSGGGFAFEAAYTGNCCYISADYNNYYASGEHLINYMDNWPGYPIDDLDSWKTFTNSDVHSISVDPAFTSADDLHAPAHIHVGSGTPVSITTDIDRQVRHAQHPSIGADEFGIVTLNNISILGYNEEMLCSSDLPLSLLLRNSGQNPLTSFTITWSVNGSPEQSQSWTGVLQPHGEMSYTLPLSPFVIEQSYVIDVDITEVNGVVDAVVEDNNFELGFTLHAKVDLGQDIVRCEGETIAATLDAHAGYVSYLWDNGATAQTRNVNSAGLYKVQVMDANGCQSRDSVSVRVDAHATIFATQPVICGDEPLTLIAGPGEDAHYTHTWKRNDVVVGTNDDSLTVTDPGVYTVTVTSSSCSFTSEPFTLTAVTKPATPAIVVSGSTRLCAGDSVLLSAAEGMASYVWSDGHEGRMYYVKSSGTYSLNVSGEGSCYSNSSEPVVVIIEECPTLVISSDGTTLTAPEGDSYQWYLDGVLIVGATGRDYTPTASGHYTVAVTTNGLTNKSSSFDFLVTAIISAAEMSHLVLYPVPTERYVRVERVLALKYRLTFAMHDYVGKVINTPATWDGEDLVIDLANATPGVYFLELKCDGVVETRKVVKR